MFATEQTRRAANLMLIAQYREDAETNWAASRADGVLDARFDGAFRRKVERSLPPFDVDQLDITRPRYCGIASVMALPDIVAPSALFAHRQSSAGGDLHWMSIRRSVSLRKDKQLLTRLNQKRRNQ
jgi:hypothetical protein